MTQVHIFPSPPERRVRELLHAAALPAADLTAIHLEHFFGCGDEHAPQGVVGVELDGANALLRSLAVAESARGRGCGKALVDSAERHAREHGARRMFLLTTTAEEFFESLGYARIARDEVPETIRATQEFAALCPVSAAVMAKDLSN
jgi:amino-acid N-acetyltransferase